MKEKFKSYSFWVGLSGAVVVLIDAIGKAFGFISDGELISNIIMGIAGILVVFGVVTMPVKKSDKKNKEIEIKDNTNENEDVINLK